MCVGTSVREIACVYEWKCVYKWMREFVLSECISVYVSVHVRV